MNLRLSIPSAPAFAGAALAAALVIAAGCAKKSEVASNATPAASVAAVSSSQASAGPESSASPVGDVTSPAPQSTEGSYVTGSDKTGLPMYPGAKQDTSISGAGNSGAATMIVTTDSFDKVYAWYQSQIPADWQRAKMDTADGSVATFQLEQGSTTKSVMVAGTKDKTTITLASSTK
jgi:hypothetical protein